MRKGEKWLVDWYWNMIEKVYNMYYLGMISMYDKEQAYLEIRRTYEVAGGNY